MRHYATACKAEQVPLLARSMLDHCESFTLHVLAWDWKPGPPWSAWGEQRCDFVYTTRDELLTRHPELASLPGPPRTVNETVCAVRWQFLCDVMLETGLPVTLIDGDQWFWSNPEPLFEEIGDAPVAFSPHVFAPAAAGMRGVTLESHARYGRFNGGWSYWSDIGRASKMAALARECSRAAEHRWPDGRVTWGDQGALTVIYETLDAHVIQHPGVNVGPWNIHTLSLRQACDGRLFFGNERLISYHYSSFRLGEQDAFPEYDLTDRQRELLYRPYETAVRRINR